jgi:hypothetical protein
MGVDERTYSRSPYGHGVLREGGEERLARVGSEMDDGSGRVWDGESEMASGRGRKVHGRRSGIRCGCKHGRPCITSCSRSRSSPSASSGESSPSLSSFASPLASPSSSSSTTLPLQAEPSASAGSHGTLSTPPHPSTVLRKVNQPTTTLWIGGSSTT